MMVQKRGRKAWMFTTTFLCLGIYFPSAAHAQEAAPPTQSTTTSERDDPTTDDDPNAEIVVTARKQSEELSKIGLAITAATGTQLAERGVTSVGGLVKIEPSLQFSKSFDSTPIFTIRGVGYNDNSLQAPPTVSVYQDEIPYTYPVMTKGALLDVQRVEVLKGPQGTLYGQNATGGAINFIANKPTDYFAAGVTASYGRFNAAHFDGYISGPLTDELTARLAASIDRGGAWQRSYTRDDTLGDKDLLQGRILLDWKPASNFNAMLNLNAWRDRSDTQAQQLIGIFVKSPQFVGLGAGNNRPTAAQIAAMPAYASLLQPILLQPIAPEDNRAADWAIGTHPHANQRFYQAALRMNWTVNSAFSVTSLTSFEHYTQRDQVDNAGVGVLANTRENSGQVDSFFQEIRLHGDLGLGGNWQIGGNYIHDDSNQLVTQYITQSGSYFSGFPPSVGGNPPFHNLLSYANNTTETKSIFGSISLPLLSALKLNASVRYTDVRSEFGGCVGSPDPQIVALVSNVFGDGSATAADQCLTVLTPKGPSGYVRFNLNEHNVPWRIGLEFQATDNTLLYALVSQGYKAAAAPVLTATVSAQLRPVTQESLLDYEVGIKSNLFNNSLRLTAGAFFYDYKDKQLLGRTVDPVFGALQALLNIPKSREYGAEASFLWRAAGGLTVDGAVTYLDSRVESDFPNTDAYGNPTNFQGQPFPFTPKWSTVGGARYSWDVNEVISAFVSARGSYQSSTTASFGQSAALASGAPSLAIKSYALLDLSAGISLPDDRLRVEIWGRNVTDTYYWNNVNYVGDGTARLTGLPASYGVTVGYNF